MSNAEGLDERLFQAVEKVDVASARAALANGADAKYVRVESGDSFRYETPVLFVACERKSRELVELLLAHGADPSSRREKRDSWVQIDTCLRGAMPSLEIVTLLLEKGANPNLPSESGESARMEVHPLDDDAATPEIKALLKQHGAEKKKKR